VLRHVGDDEARDRRVHRGVDPAVDKARRSAAAGAAEQGGAVGIRIFEVVGDRPGIEHDLVAVDEHGHTPLPRHGDRLLVGEAPRHGLGGEAFVGQRQASAPAERAEAPLGIGTGEIEELHAQG
jgi:hypothetical protein